MKFYLILTLIIIGTISGYTYSGGVMYVDPNDYATIDNGATTYLLNIWTVLQFIPTIAMIAGGFFILSKMIGLFNKN